MQSPLSAMPSSSIWTSASGRPVCAARSLAVKGPRGMALLSLGLLRREHLFDHGEELRNVHARKISTAFLHYFQ